MIGSSLARAMLLPLLAASTTVLAAGSSPDALLAGFEDPPVEARPLVWWHWLNGNVSREGIAKDLDWMARTGIGGLHQFDVALKTEQIVSPPLSYMSPEWKGAFDEAVSRADARGLEFGIASSPGWSATGGPWVPPADGLKKLVWSETDVVGGRRFDAVLAAPPSVTGPFQNMRKPSPPPNGLGDPPPSSPIFYQDAAVLAFPVADSRRLAPPTYLDAEGSRLDGPLLDDDDQASQIELTAGDRAPSVTIAYPQVQTVRSATIFIPGATSIFAPSTLLPRLEASEDGTSWRSIAEVELSSVPSTVSFAPVRARQFRLVLAPRPNLPKQPSRGVAGAVASAFTGSALVAGPTIRLATFRLSSDPRVNQYELKAGFGIARDYYALDAHTRHEDGFVDPAAVVDLTDRMAPDGSLDWSPPPGRWRVLRLGWSLTGTTNHPAATAATGLEVDKFDGAAVRRYLQTYLAGYAIGSRAGGSGIDTLLTDSIEVGAANWTPRILTKFERLRGYDPRPWLPALTGTVVGSRERSDAFLYDFRRTLSDLIAEQHYGQVAAVAHEHGMRVYGEALELGRPMLGDDMAMRRHADVPMSALWAFPAGEEPRRSHVADMKGASSVAHVYGRRVAAAEALTSINSPWAYSPADLKPALDLAFASGINRPVIHTSVHQPSDEKVPGLSLAIFGQYFNRHETWAEMAKPWVDYIARSSYLLQQGDNVADVAYFYGEEGPLTALYRDEPVADAPTRYAYDFVNADILLRDLSVSEGSLVTTGGARYRALYLGGSSRLMTLPVLRRIAALVDAGATVIGEAPESSPSLADDPREFRALVERLWPARGGRVLASSDVEAALASIGLAPDVESDVPIRFVHRQLADGHIYFVSNPSGQPVSTSLRFRVGGKRPELWRADDGTAAPLSYRFEGGRTVVELDLAANDAVFVVLREPAAAPSLRLAPIVPALTEPISRPWEVTFQPGRGAPARMRLASLRSLSESEDPAIRYFSGVASYLTRFRLPAGVAPGEPLMLDLGQVGDVATVFVNGRPVGTVWKTPYRLDVGDATRRGWNELEVKVANLWVNRLIGDAQPGARRIAFTAVPTYRADAPLRASGLIGPVTLSTFRSQTASRLPSRRSSQDRIR